jgi:hypothetical protein
MTKHPDPTDFGVIRHRDAAANGGYTITANAILSSPRLTDGELRCYQLILMHAYGKDGAWPGQLRLGAMMNKSERMIRYYLESLERHRLISIEQRGLSLTNIYWIEPIPAIFIADRQPIAGQDRQPIAAQDRQPIADKEDQDPNKNKTNKTNSDSLRKSPRAYKQTEYDPAFEALWASYPKRNGKRLTKPETYRVWLKLSAPDRALLLVAVENYSRSEVVVVLGAPKDFIRFLKNDFWREWIEPETPRKTRAQASAPPTPAEHKFSKWRAAVGVGEDVA